MQRHPQGVLRHAGDEPVVLLIAGLTRARDPCTTATAGMAMGGTQAATPVP